MENNLSSEGLLAHFSEEGIIVDKDAFTALVNRMIGNKLMKPLVLSYFKKLGKKYASKLMIKGVVDENNENLVELVLELCKMNGYFEDYEIKRNGKDGVEVLLKGALFGREAKKRGRLEKADEPLAKFMEGMYEVFSMEPVKVSEKACIAEGNDRCVFVFKTR